MHRLLALVVLAGCYAPAVEVGGACGVGDACPAGQHCYTGRCLLGPPADDAPTDTGPSPTWLEPTKIPGINTPGDETDPSFTPDRKTIVFGRDGDLYIGTRADTTSAFTVTRLDALSSPMALEQSPEISADGRTIYFSSDIAMPGVAGDIFRSRFSGGLWSGPQPVSEFNTPDDEGDIAISPDGLTAIVARGGELMKSTRASTTASWSMPVTTGITADGPASPSINAAGDIYFHANPTRDLFVARKQGSGYAAAVAIAELNTEGRDAAPFISPDDLYMFFERDADLYETHR